MPLVYWMLIGSSNCSSASRLRTASFCTAAAAVRRSSQLVGSEEHDPFERRDSVGRTASIIAT